MSTRDKPLVWLHGELKTPPFSAEARIEAGYLLRLLQKGEKLSLPHSRPMPSIGARCHELRIVDETKNWRIIYRIDVDEQKLKEILRINRQTDAATIIAELLIERQKEKIKIKQAFKPNNNIAEEDKW